MKNLYIYLILALIAIYFFYHSFNFVEGYKNAKVFVGSTPHSHNSLLFENNNFGSHSIYELGIIENPYLGNINNMISKNNVYDSSFGNTYGGYYQGYYG
jgi:hypothetical protein